MSDVDSYVPSTLPRRSQSWPAVTEALSERELIYMTPDLDDHDGIVAAVQAYVDGFNDRDPKKFKRAFYEDAWMYFIDEAGTLQKRPLDEELFEIWANEGVNFELRVLSVHQMGDAANVALACGNEWFDFHNLLKIDGEWKIMNKSASHRSR